MMAMATPKRPCHSVQLINDNAEFNKSGVESFINNIKHQVAGASYGIVAIIGRQSTGKSTLLNELFNCDFQVRDVDEETAPCATTKGVWLAYNSSNTLVMDIEGADGSFRGEDTSFEKRTALLAIAAADVVLINMKHEDVGSESAGLKPLLRTIFGINKKLHKKQDKITLMYVVRDHRGSKKNMENILKASTQEIWDSIPKFGDEAPVSEIFNVEVVSLPYFEKPQWKNEVTELSGRIGNLDAFKKTKKIDVSGFGELLRKMWQDILEDKEIDIPSLNVLTATFQCDKIIGKIYSDFVEKVDEVGKMAKSLAKDDFKRRLGELKNESLSRYDTDTRYYDVKIRTEKRDELNKKLESVVEKIETDEEHERKAAEKTKKALTGIANLCLVGAEVARSAIDCDSFDSFLEKFGDQVKWNLLGSMKEQPILESIIVPPVPAFRESDRFPGMGAGMYTPRGDSGGGGLLVGPNDPRFFEGRSGGSQGVIPPGARFDPIGPPDVHGFEPSRYVRNPHRPDKDDDQAYSVSDQNEGDDDSVITHGE